MSGRSAQPIRGWSPWNSPQATRLEPPPAAECERCGCKLSRYRDAYERHCAPCTRVLGTEGALVVPDFEATPEPVSSAERARQAVTAATRRPPPLTLEQKQASRHYKPCTCGRDWHKKRTNHCKHCEADRRRTPGTPGSSFCAKCGERKGHNGGGLCRLCRYPDSEEARLRRLRERAA
jgi:hypothetical protein